MNVSNFTEKSKEVITVASNLTTGNNNAEITDFHLMEAFLEDKQGIVTLLFKKMHVDVRTLESVIKTEIDKMPKISGSVALRF